MGVPVTKVVDPVDLKDSLLDAFDTCVASIRARFASITIAPEDYEFVQDYIDVLHHPEQFFRKGNH